MYYSIAPYAFHAVMFLKYLIAISGILIIFTGIAVAITQYVGLIMRGKMIKDGARINDIRLGLVRILVLGLEFIVAADLISTIVMPDYRTVGLVAIIVLIRTLLSYSLNKELAMLSKK